MQREKDAKHTPLSSIHFVRFSYIYTSIWASVCTYVELLSLKIDVDLIYMGLWLGCHVQYALHLSYTPDAWQFKQKVGVLHFAILYTHEKNQPTTISRSKRCYCVQQYRLDCRTFQFYAPQRHSHSDSQIRENNEQKKNQHVALKGSNQRFTHANRNNG